MTAAVLIAATLAQPACRMAPNRARVVVRADLASGLPEGLLVAVVLAETGGRNVVARGRGRGRRGCDVGIAQIHVPDCPQKRVKTLMSIERNLAEAVRVLRWGKTTCRRHPGLWWCRRGWWWAGYNPGSRRWARRVWRTWQELRRFGHVRT